MSAKELISQHNKLRKECIELLTKIVSDSGGKQHIEDIISVDDIADDYGEFPYIYHQLQLLDDRFVAHYVHENGDGDKRGVDSIDTDTLIIMLDGLT